MNEFDQAQLLGHLPPHVRAELLRRVEVVRRYVSGKSRAAAEAGAAELGLGIVHFKKLAHVWELHGRADRLPGADWPKTKRSATTPAQLAVLETASETAPEETIEAVVRIAIRTAAERGVAMPSRGTMRARVMEMREGVLAPGTFGSASSLVILHAALDVPVANGDSSTMPVATLAVEPTTRRILGLDLGLGGAEPRGAAVAIRNALTRLPAGASPTSGWGEVRIAMDLLADPAWSDLAAVLRTAGAEVIGENRVTPRRDLAAVYLGREVGGIDVRPRMVDRPPGERHPYLESGQTAITLEEAIEFAERRMIPTVTPTASHPGLTGIHVALERWLGRPD